jgi:hypothetical protein
MALESERGLADVVIGVHGVTGAGQTVLGRELAARVSHTHFSNSAVLEQYSTRIGLKRRNSLFASLSESTTMSVLFGDVHYSFPRIRLGLMPSRHRT